MSLPLLRLEVCGARRIRFSMAEHWRQSPPAHGSSPSYITPSICLALASVSIDC